MLFRLAIEFIITPRMKDPTVLLSYFLALDRTMHLPLIFGASVQHLRSFSPHYGFVHIMTTTATRTVHLIRKKTTVENHSSFHRPLSSQILTQNGREILYLTLIEARLVWLGASLQHGAPRQTILGRFGFITVSLPSSY